MLTTTSLIEAAQQEDGSVAVKVGGETVATFDDLTLGYLAATAARKAYAAGRRDQRTETGAILRGLMAPG